jgi:hydroxymethylpyrimidine pyrophosphatase-like HAD family hydrolase
MTMKEANGIQIIFFDVDDTLLWTKTQRVPESAVQAIQRARAKGIKIAVATWRNMKMPLESGPLSCISPIDVCVSHGGALTFTPDGVIDSQPLSVADANVVLESGLPSIAFRESTITTHGDAGALFRKFLRAPSRLAGFVPAESSEPSGIFFMVLPGAEAGALPELEEAVVRTWNLRTVMRRGCGKASGVAAALSSLGLKKENAMAFGDADSDAELLEAAKIGVAMANGSPRLMAKATFVAARIEKDGVAKALQHFGLA